jgi:hypothetical protein
MKRDGWENALMEYVNSVRNQPCNWNGFDCLTFCNEAVKVQTGKGFAEDWIGKYKCPISALKFYIQELKRTKTKSIIDAIDNKFPRRFGKMPWRGDLVARPQEIAVLNHSFGISISDLIAFSSNDGIVFEKPKSKDIFWAIQ